jgi:hypothetical protein
MSRESAYRLRDRKDGALFATLWDQMLQQSGSPREVHSSPVSNGRIMRLLGTHFRRNRGDFLAIGSTRAAASET